MQRRQHGSSGGLQQPLKGDLHEKSEGERHHNTEIGIAVLNNIRRGCLTPDKGPGDCQSENCGDDKAKEGQKDAVVRRLV